MRRQFLRTAGRTALAAFIPVPLLAAASPGFGGDSFAGAVRAAEAQGGGRLGVAVLDTETGRQFDWHGGERFPLASTFKLVLAAAVLAEADQGSQSRQGHQDRVRLDRRLPIAASDLVEYAPVTGRRVGTDGMSVAELCEATMVWSDNPAANLLLPLVGGPAGLTRIARGWGDDRFRLDRIETALGEGRPGDLRDTTTPSAMIGLMNRLLLGSALSPASRAQLTAWLVACRTGDTKIRAGLPKNWRCGDKTGGGGFGTNNDVAIVWPPGRAPVLVACYLTESAASPEARNAALAAVGRAVALGVAG